MCGLYTVRTRFTTVFGESLELATPPAIRVFPGDRASIVRNESGTIACVAARWGFRPGWAERKQALINARAEGLAGSRMFRNAFQRQRCLVIATGFFEPNRRSAEKQYFWFHRSDDEPFTFAGIWTHFRREGEPESDTYAIITTEPNKVVGLVHPRMPAILTPDQHAVWLDPECDDPAVLGRILQPAAEDLLAVRRVADNLYKLARDDIRAISESGATDAENRRLGPD